MAVVELQFRERAFLELIGSEALRPPLASLVLDEVRRRRAGPLAARLHLTGVEWGRPFLRARPPAPGAVLVKASLGIELTGAPGTRERTAPASAAARGRRLGAEAWIEVSVDRAGPWWRLVELRTVAPVADLATASVPLLAGEDAVAVDHGAMVVGEGVVSVRMATAAGDDVSGAVVDRLGSHDWARFVPGDVLAHRVGGALEDTLDAVTAWPGTDLRVERPTAARWCAGGPGPDGSMAPRAVAEARLVAVGALPFAFDLPFALTARTTFTVGRPASPVAAPVLCSTTAVAVDPGDPDLLVTFDPLDLLREDLRTGLDGRLDGTPAGAVAVEEGPGRLRVEARDELPAPATRAWAGVVVDADLDDGGLTSRGVLALRQPGEIDLRDRPVTRSGGRAGGHLRRATPRSFEDRRRGVAT